MPLFEREKMPYTSVTNTGKKNKDQSEKLEVDN